MPIISFGRWPGYSFTNERQDEVMQPLWLPFRWARMPRYFFHMTTDRSGADDEGVILPDDNSARRTAMRAFGEALRDNRAPVDPNSSRRMFVVDETGRVVVVLSLEIRF